MTIYKKHSSKKRIKKQKPMQNMTGGSTTTNLIEVPLDVGRILIDNEYPEGYLRYSVEARKVFNQVQRMTYMEMIETMKELNEKKLRNKAEKYKKADIYYATRILNMRNTLGITVEEEYSYHIPKDCPIKKCSDEEIKIVDGKIRIKVSF